MNPDRSAILSVVCALLGEGQVAAAAARVQAEYPFEPVAAVERKYGEAEATRVFKRDGFVDRYSGARLIFPGASAPRRTFVAGAGP